MVYVCVCVCVCAWRDDGASVAQEDRDAPLVVVVVAAAFVCLLVFVWWCGDCVRIWGWQVVAVSCARLCGSAGHCCAPLGGDSVGASEECCHTDPDPEHRVLLVVASSPSWCCCCPVFMLSPCLLLQSHGVSCVVVLCACSVLLACLILKSQDTSRLVLSHDVS